jgi:hypothetical protein
MIMQGQSKKVIALAPSEVVLLSVKALNAGDLEGALMYFAGDAEYQLIGLPFDQPDSLKGTEQLRDWLKELSTQHSYLEVEVLDTEGDIVTTRTLIWSDLTRQLGVAPLAAIEQYFIRDGRIIGAIRGIYPESAAKLQAALSHAQE